MLKGRRVMRMHPGDRTTARRENGRTVQMAFGGGRSGRVEGRGTSAVTIVTAFSNRGAQKVASGEIVMR